MIIAMTKKNTSGANPVIVLKQKFVISFRQINQENDI